MKKNCLIIVSLILLFIAGCVSSTRNLSNYTEINVDLSKRNFRVVKPNLIGESYGFRLLGIIPIVSTSYNRAMTDLSSQANISTNISATEKTVLVGTVEETHTFLILFSVPKLTIRADLIELSDENEKK